MELGVSLEKILLIGFIAAVLVGPERLPRYAENLARFVKRAKEWMQGARSRVKEEMGEDFDVTDWRKLDPRQYDPRRIIREALLDDAPVAAPAAAAAAAATTVRPPRTAPLTRQTFTADDPPPFDPEAT
jgi:sec-independent protein translocase protein TatB